MLKTNFKGYNIQENLVAVRINDNYFKRRGGLKYLKKVINFKYSLFKIKYINFFEFLLSTLPHMVVCLMPVFLRKKFYIKFLRVKK